MFPSGSGPQSAPIRGAEAIWDFFVEVLDAWEEGSSEVGELIDAGTDRIVANQRREMHGKASRAEVVWSFWVVFTFRDGTVVRFEWFADRADALEAVGLRSRPLSVVALPSGPLKPRTDGPLG